MIKPSDKSHNKLFSKLVKLVTFFSLLFLFTVINSGKVRADIDIYGGYTQFGDEHLCYPADYVSCKNNAVNKFWDTDENYPSYSFKNSESRKMGMELVSSSNSRIYLNKYKENGIYTGDADIYVGNEDWILVDFFTFKGDPSLGYKYENDFYGLKDLHTSYNSSRKELYVRSSDNIDKLLELSINNKLIKTLPVAHFYKIKFSYNTNEVTLNDPMEGETFFDYFSRMKSKKIKTTSSGVRYVETVTDSELREYANNYFSTRIVEITIPFYMLQYGEIVEAITLTPLEYTDVIGPVALSLNTLVSNENMSVIRGNIGIEIVKKNIFGNQPKYLFIGNPLAGGVLEQTTDFFQETHDGITFSRELLGIKAFIKNFESGSIVYESIYNSDKENFVIDIPDGKEYIVYLFYDYFEYNKNKSFFAGYFIFRDYETVPPVVTGEIGNKQLLLKVKDEASGIAIEKINGFIKDKFGNIVKTFSKIDGSSGIIAIDFDGYEGDFILYVGDGEIKDKKMNSINCLESERVCDNDGKKNYVEIYEFLNVDFKPPEVIARTENGKILVKVKDTSGFYRNEITVYFELRESDEGDDCLALLSAKFTSEDAKNGNEIELELFEGEPLLEGSYFLFYESESVIDGLGNVYPGSGCREATIEGDFLVDYKPPEVTAIIEGGKIKVTMKDYSGIGSDFLNWKVISKDNINEVVYESCIDLSNVINKKEIVEVLEFKKKIEKTDLIIIYEYIQFNDKLGNVHDATNYNGLLDHRIIPLDGTIEYKLEIDTIGPRVTIDLPAIKLDDKNIKNSYILKNETVKITVEDMSLNDTFESDFKFKVNGKDYTTKITFNNKTVGFTWDDLFKNIPENDLSILKNDLKIYPITFVETSIQDDKGNESTYTYEVIESEVNKSTITQYSDKNPSGATFYLDVHAPEIIGFNCGDKQANYCYDTNNMKIKIVDFHSFDAYEYTSLPIINIDSSFLQLETFSGKIVNSNSFDKDGLLKIEETNEIVIDIGEFLKNVKEEINRSYKITITLRGSSDGSIDGIIKDGYGNSLINPTLAEFYFSNIYPTIEVNDGEKEITSININNVSNVYVINNGKNSASIKVSGYPSYNYIINKYDTTGYYENSKEKLSYTNNIIKLSFGENVEIYEVSIVPLQENGNKVNEVNKYKTVIYILKFYHSSGLTEDILLDNNTIFKNNSLVTGYTLDKLKEDYLKILKSEIANISNSNIKAIISNIQNNILYTSTEDENNGAYLDFKDGNLVLENVSELDDLKLTEFTLTVSAILNGKQYNMLEITFSLNISGYKYVEINHNGDSISCNNKKCSVNASNAKDVKIYFELFEPNNNVTINYKIGDNNYSSKDNVVDNNKQITNFIKASHRGTLKISSITINEKVYDSVKYANTYDVYTKLPSATIEFENTGYNDYYNNSEFKVNVTSSDVEHIKDISYVFDDLNGNYNIIPNGALVENNKSLMDGEHTLYVKVSDKYGNVISLNKSFKVDRTAPVVVYEIQAKQANNNIIKTVIEENEYYNEVTISVSKRNITETGSGFNSIQICENNTDTGNCEYLIKNEDTNSSKSKTYVDNKIEKIILIAKDKLGNEKVITYNVKIDSESLEFEVSNAKRIVRSGLSSIPLEFEISVNKEGVERDYTKTLTSTFDSIVNFSTSLNGKKGTLSFVLNIGTSTTKNTIYVPTGLFKDKVGNLSKSVELEIEVKDNPINIKVLYGDTSKMEAYFVDGKYYVSNISSIKFLVDGVTDGGLDENKNEESKWSYDNSTNILTFDNRNNSLTSITIPAGLIYETNEFYNESVTYEFGVVNEENINIKVFADNVEYVKKNNDLYLSRKKLDEYHNGKIVVAIKYMNQLIGMENINYYLNGQGIREDLIGTLAYATNDIWVTLTLDVGKYNEIKFSFDKCSVDSKTMNICIFNFKDVSHKKVESLNIVKKFNSNGSIIEKIFIDGDAPKISDIKYTKEYVKENQEITFKVSDLASGSGIKEVLWSKDNISYSSLVACESGLSLYEKSCSITTDFENMTSGDHNIYVKAKDNLDNEVTEIVTIKVDVDAPTFNVEHNVSNASAQSFKFKVKDLSDINLLGEESKVIYSYKLIGISYELLDDGTLPFYIDGDNVKVSNDARKSYAITNNTFSIGTEIFNLDNGELPFYVENNTVKVRNDNSKSYLISNKIFSIYSDDYVNSCEYDISNNDNDFMCEFKNSGTYMVKISVNDALNNVNSVEYEIKVDTESPRITILNKTGTYAKKHELLFSVKDNYVVNKLTATCINSCIITKDKENYKAYIENQTSLTGIFKIKITAEDEAGNTVSVEQDVFLDNTAPSITLKEVFLDKTAPSIILKPENDNSLYYNSITIKHSFSDEYSGIDDATMKYCVIKINDEDDKPTSCDGLETINITSLNGEITFDKTIIKESGKYEIIYEVSDNAGNHSNASSVLNFDVVAPTIESVDFVYRENGLSCKEVHMNKCSLKIIIKDDLLGSGINIESLGIIFTKIIAKYGEYDYAGQIIKKVETNKDGTVIYSIEISQNEDNIDYEFIIGNETFVLNNYNLPFYIEGNVVKVINDTNKSYPISNKTFSIGGEAFNLLDDGTLPFFIDTDNNKERFVKVKNSDNVYVITSSYLSGIYRPTIIVKDNAGNSLNYSDELANTQVCIDTKKPEITWTNENSYVDSSDDTNKLEITLEVKDNYKLSSDKPLSFGGIDGKWFKYSGPNENGINGIYSYTIEFNSEKDKIERREYSFIVYAYDEGGNVSSKEINVNYTRPTLNDIKIILNEIDTNTQIDVTNDPIIIFDEKDTLTIKVLNENYRIILENTMNTEFTVSLSGKKTIRIVDSVGNISSLIEKYVFIKSGSVTITKEDGELTSKYKNVYYGEVIDSNIKYKNVYKEVTDDDVIHLVNDAGGKYKLIKTLIKDNMNSEQALIGSKIANENTITINNKKYLLIVVEDNKDKANELRKELNPDTSNPSEIIDSGSKKESGESSKVDVTVLVTIAIIFSVVGGFFAVRRLRRRVRSA